MIGCIADWSSIIGLAISFGALIFAFFIDRKVHEVKQKVLFNTRVSPLLDDFKIFTDNIRRLYPDFERNKNELKLEIAKCKVQIEGIIPKLQKSQKQEFTQLIKQIRIIQKNKLGENPENLKVRIFQKSVKFTSQEDIWDLYVALIACVNKLDILIKDKSII